MLQNHLPPELRQPERIERVVAVVGRNPLSLRLAADLLVRAKAEQLGDEEMWRRVGDQVVQGRLYERIALHIHDEEVRRLAIPGLVLRYVTPELIRNVLAAPCGVDPNEADRLFDAL